MMTTDVYEKEKVLKTMLIDVTGRKKTGYPDLVTILQIPVVKTA